MDPAAPTPKLFAPIDVGTMALRHRVVLAPLTRLRNDAAHVPLDLVRVHYAQRARTPGTLLITDATIVAGRAGGSPHIPGIWTADQIAAWKRVVDAVHAEGSYIFCQLWALGRIGRGDVLLGENPEWDVVSASDIKLSKSSWVPRPLTIEEIKEYVQLFAQAARNAVHGAGFDGVEVHGGNGYLPDQFLQDVSNTRTDEYGGSIENRSRFTLEIMDAIVDAVGAERAAIRISPWSRYNEMHMDALVPQFTHLVQSLPRRLAYLHVVEPRVFASNDIPGGAPAGESNDFVRALWAPRPLISAGGYDRALAMEVADQKGDLIAFGRHFIANPDLPERLLKDIPLHPYDRSTFYAVGSPSGYIDQPFAEEEFAGQEEQKEGDL